MSVYFFSSKKPFHLLGFPLLFVVNHFFGIVPLTSVYRIDNFWFWALNFFGSVILCFCLSFTAYKILLLFFNHAKSAILSTIVLLPFFFFQDIFLSAEQFAHLGLRTRWVLPILSAALLTVCYWVIKAKRSFILFNQYLNVVSTVLIAYTSIMLILSFEKLKPRILNFSPPLYSLGCQNCPDVYLLVLDSYTSNKSLRDYFQFDNSDFSERLKGFSFEVVDQARSLYSRTEYSLSATLNLNDIGDLDKYTGGLNEAIQMSSVTQSFQRAGYEINNYSLFQINDKPAYYSIVPDPSSVTVINRIVQSTILNMIYDYILKTELYDIHSGILRNIVRKQKKYFYPGFYYGHIFAPHPPFVINEDGAKIDFVDQTKNANNKDAYVAQVKGLNKMVLGAVDSIIRYSPNAIIIITGDHGYRYLEDPRKNDEAFTVFLAYRGPNQTELSLLPNSNDIFRLVFSGLNGKILQRK
jgi:hypothetical protein